MARGQTDLLSRLADAGEEAIQRFGDTPGADRLLGAVTSLRDRMDELQKKVRGIDVLERRLEELEARVDELTGGKPSAKRASPAKPRGARSKKSSPSSASGSGSKT
ncbi:MAG: hypothetical protein QOE36_653 [Gaiellaceae bacterium]|nr:hypothetical protein [Gaiellaceae bacterium]